MITVEARPESVAIDPRRAAVLVIDMQNDFGAPGGMFERAGVDIGGIAAAAEATRPVLRAARDAGIPVVYLKMEHAPDLSDVGPDDGPHWIKHSPLRVGEKVIAPDGSESRILVRDTWNTAILDELAPEPGDRIVSKHRYSGFFETELDGVFRHLDVKHLLVTGCTTSVCVESRAIPVRTTKRPCSSSRRSSGGCRTHARCSMRSRGRGSWPPSVLRRKTPANARV